MLVINPNIFRATLEISHHQTFLFGLICTIHQSNYPSIICVEFLCLSRFFVNWYPLYLSICLCVALSLTSIFLFNINISAPYVLTSCTQWSYTRHIKLIGNFEVENIFQPSRYRPSKPDSSLEVFGCF